MKMRTFSIKKPSHIVVIGVGGGGCSAVNRMILDGVRNVDFIAVNTESFALSQSVAPHKIQLGRPGLGAGGSVKRGRITAQDAHAQIKEAVQHAKMVFVMAGLGGGTGTGAAPVVAQIARELGILTVGIVTYPFQFEGRGRMQTAKNGMTEVRANCDTVIAIPNDRLLEITADAKASINESFAHVDNVLKRAVQCITEVVDVRGEINVDFNDVRSVLSEGGASIMSMGVATGEDKARIAAERAVVANPLNITIEGARGIIFNVTSGPDVILQDVETAANIVRQHAHPDVNLIYGNVIDESMRDEMRITLIASGFDFIDPMPMLDAPQQEATMQMQVVTPTPPVKKPVKQPRRVYVTNPTRSNSQATSTASRRNGSVRTINRDLPAFLRN